MKNLILIAIALLLFPLGSQSRDIFRIEIGSDYSTYSRSELRRRVWHLERAVSQLQEQVFHLSMNNRPQVGARWSCHMRSFGKTYRSSGVTRAEALGKVIEKCSNGSNAIHCQESDAQCGNE